MFERYTEEARRVLFFACQEASEFGSPHIETEHLLLGFLRADRQLSRRLLPNTSAESLLAAVRPAHTRL
jgi:ATP-dependent Clp protease ATP-binding subunit ClpC